MAVGFDVVPFDVYPDEEGWLPQPTPSEDGTPDRWEATILLDSAAALADLRAYRSRYTAVPALGFVSGGTLVVEAGRGVRALTYPTAGGGETTVDAVLIAIAPLGHMLHDDAWRCQVTFLVLTEPGL